VITTTIRLEKRLKTVVDAFAERQGRDPSEFMRTAIRQYVRDQAALDPELQKLQEELVDEWLADEKAAMKNEIGFSADP
jgi:predicted transcriptional regulator